MIAPLQDDPDVIDPLPAPCSAQGRLLFQGHGRLGAQVQVCRLARSAR